MGVLWRLDIEEYLTRQIEWSRETFGPGQRLNGVVEHIREELDEIVESNGDLKEWIDVIILAFDGAWRSGADTYQIIMALTDKQRINLDRQWPDWRTTEPDKKINHVRSADTEKAGE